MSPVAIPGLETAWMNRSSFPFHFHKVCLPPRLCALVTFDSFCFLQTFRGLPPDAGQCYGIAPKIPITKIRNPQFGCGLSPPQDLL